MNTDVRLDTSAVSDRTGISARRLGHWDRLGIVSPSIAPGRGSGSRRAYSRRDLVYVTLVNALREHGGSLELAQAVVGKARAVEQKEGSLSGLFLVTSPEDVLYCGGDTEAMTAVLGQKRSALTFCFDVLLREAAQLSTAPSQPEVRVVELEGMALQVVVFPEGDHFRARCNAYPTLAASGKSVDAVIDVLAKAIRFQRAERSERPRVKAAIAPTSLGGTGAATWGGDW